MMDSHASVWSHRKKRGTPRAFSIDPNARLHDTPFLCIALCRVSLGLRGGQGNHQLDMFCREYDGTIACRRIFKKWWGRVCVAVCASSGVHGLDPTTITHHDCMANHAPVSICIHKGTQEGDPKEMQHCRTITIWQAMAFGLL